MRLSPISILAAATSTIVQAQSYKLEPFAVVNPVYGPLNTSALGINNRGAVFGILDFSAKRDTGGRYPVKRGFKRAANGVFEYPIIAPQDDAGFTSPQGINNFGVIVGYYSKSPGYFAHGFIDDQGTFTTVDEGGGPNTWVLGVNELGDYVGAFGVNTSPEHGFSRINGKFQQIDVPNAQLTHAQTIAYEGTVVGCTDPFTKGSGFLVGPQGKMTTFRVEGSTVTCVWGINNAAGTIVRYYGTADNLDHGFVYNYGTNGAPSGDIKVITVDYPGAALTWVTGINAQGIIVGRAQLSATGPMGGAVGFFGTP